MRFKNALLKTRLQTRVRKWIPGNAFVKNGFPERVKNAFLERVMKITFVKMRFKNVFLNAL